MSIPFLLSVSAFLEINRITKWLANSMISKTEPDSLANLVTNLNVAKCAAAESAYLQCVNYAVTQLNLPNVAMYIDAGTSPWIQL